MAPLPDPVVGTNMLAIQRNFEAISQVLPYTGKGSPENLVAAPVGSMYLRTDGGAGTTLYVKETGGITKTGWSAK